MDTLVHHAGSESAHIGPCNGVKIWIDDWKRDAANRICAGSGLPVRKPGNLFGTCQSCGASLIIHDGPAREWRAQRHKVPENDGPGLTIRNY